MSARGPRVALLAVGAAVAVGAAMALAIGESPLAAGRAIVSGVLLDRDGIGAILFDATTLALTGLSVAFAFRAGLFNIGAEGQLTVGAFAAAVMPLAFPRAPGYAIVPLAAVSAACAGGIWGAIPGLLRARLGGHEVLNTIMMNFVAAGLTGYLTVHVLRPAGEMIPQTPAIPAAAEIPRLGALPVLRSVVSPASPANTAVFVALGAAIVVSWTLARTPFGFRVRSLGLGERAAHTAGVPTRTTLVLAMTVAGALAGLAGVNEVLGFRHRFLDNFAGGVGFLGIAVALLGGARPLGVLAAAVLFGALNAGAVELDISTGIPRELVLVVQAAILLVATAGDELLRLLGLLARGLRGSRA
jgi:simple sugar transport system permease protein